MCRLEGQILARFEEENGGKLLIATLCLLEVSARGLLEVELLSVLGDEDNLMAPCDVGDSEKDDEESVGKSKHCHSLCHTVTQCVSHCHSLCHSVTQCVSQSQRSYQGSRRS